jgi:molybdopterin-guanine dinucleotide biosynthesis protein A
MGRDKATLILGNMPLWEQQTELLDAVCESVAVVSAHRPKWLPEPRLWIPDIPEIPGPLAGLLAALEWARAMGATHVIVLAVDLPKMTTEFLSELWTTSSPAVGAVPSQSSGAEPLAAVYPVEALESLRQQAAGDRWKLQEAVTELVKAGHCRLMVLNETQRDCLYNVNKPIDLIAMGQMPRPEH